jgi:hypothetical protein
MKFWITKYALTAGIEEVEGEVTTTSADMLRYDVLGSITQYAHGEGREWHSNHKSAIARAESMRLKKIANLRKQIAKLEKLSFA